MRIALLAGALAAALVASVSAAADSLILTYHGAPDRSGRYVMPGLTYERARGLRPDLRSTRPIPARSMRSRCCGASQDRARAS